MDMKRIRRLITLLNGSGVAEIDIMDASGSVRICRTHRGPVPQTPHHPRHWSSSAPTRVVPARLTPAHAAAHGFESFEHLIRAPIVGTFYGFPAPGAKAFVRVGDEVERGQVLGIIEAIKLTVQVQSDRTGRVTWILARSGEALKRQQPLFVLQYARGAARFP